MSTKLSNTDHYDASPEQIMAMLQDPDYAPAKYTDLGDVSFNVVSLEATDGGLNSVIDREVNSNLPDMAKKVLGATSKMHTEDVWRADGDGFVGNMVITSGPATITVNSTINPAGGGSDWTANFDIKVGIPMMGGKIEKAIKEETEGSLKREFEFNKGWLASH